MTGRDWIIYILLNGLEDEPMYKDGHLLGFMNPVEAAIKFNVGEATIRTWIKLKRLDAININNVYYIPVNAKCPACK